ncbi:MAG: DUF4198 domain-containing protein [Gammaproteobacteria bacterium]|nr:DUF4198 domain-containing protein [Gammaproteobacteria bacterium]
MLTAYRHPRARARSCALPGARPFLLAACWLLAGPAVAHDFWVEPAEFQPEVGAPVDVRLREGVGFKGSTLPYINEWFQDFSKVTAAGRDDVLSLQGNDPAATITLPAGAMLLGYQSNRSYVELDAAKFNSYLEDEGIEYIREARIAAGEDDEPAPEYFVRCAKALLQSGPTAGEIYKTRLGYRLELTPEANPYDLSPGDQLTFRLTWRDGPAEGLLLQAFTREDPDNVQKIRTDADGRATITLNSSGTWLVKAVSIQGIIGAPRAKWLSHWASFLFELPAP